MNVDGFTYVAFNEYLNTKLIVLNRRSWVLINNDLNAISVFDISFISNYERMFLIWTRIYNE